MNTSDNPRVVAFYALLDVHAGVRPEDALNDRWALLSPLDRGLCSALVYETIRHKLRLEAIVNRKVKKTTKYRVRLVLIIGLCQLLFFCRMSPIAITHQTVEIAKKCTIGFDKVVNAIMRSWLYERKGSKPWPRERASAGLGPNERLSIFYSHPAWLTERLVGDLGFREARALMVVNNISVPPTIRINPLVTSREEYVLTLPWPTSPTRWSPWGLTLSKAAGPPDKWPGYNEGAFNIQDESSQILGLLIGEPDSILDCCSGRGGKSLAMATLRPEAKIVSVDRHHGRLEDLELAAKRLKIPKVPQVVPCNIEELEAKVVGNNFDLVVLDAPCSGLGVIRRRPDLKWVRQPQDLTTLPETQFELINKVAEFVGPKGKLFYCVCTYTDEEGPDLMRRFFLARPDFEPYTINDIDESLRELFIEPGGLRMWPHIHGMDGFFYGLARKKA
ncbi:MAG: methyltransferase domain-containing protein [Deltaproteobacteria bacterium]|jgi:16S rRNA (cytosine967-C5)-methyltransferase|nr:methyltransferase domain-containing protein [Deltaproteobacteria bacterium]